MRRSSASESATCAVIRALTRIERYTLAEGRVEAVHDEYIDTQDRALLSAGYACRKRRSKGELRVTVKGLAAVEGEIHRREELEVVLPADTPPVSWPDFDKTESTGDCRSRDMRVLFHLNQSRLVRAVMDGNREVALSSLDDVTIDTGWIKRLV